MRITTAHLYKINLPLQTPFITSFGQMITKDFTLLVLNDEDGYSGYGECSAFSFPFYTEEFRDSAYLLLKNTLIPMILNQELTSPAELKDLFTGIRRNNMAKAAIDTAMWDLYAKRNHQSLAKSIGGNKKEILAGISRL